MRKYKFLIVEDIARYGQELVDLLNLYSKHIKVVKWVTTYKAAMDTLLEGSFDVSILDNRLNDGYDFLSLLKKIPRTRFGHVFAMSVEKEELEKKHLLIEDVNPFPKPFLEEDVRDLFAKLNRMEEDAENDFKIYFFKHGLITIKIPIADICYIEGDDSATYFFIDGESYEKTSPLHVKNLILHEVVHKKIYPIKNNESIGDVEATFGKKPKFVRTHNSFIVNTERWLWHEKHPKGWWIFFKPLYEASINNEFFAKASEPGVKRLKAINPSYLKKETKSEK